MTLSMLSKTCLEILQFAPRARNQSSCRSLRALGKSISVPRSRSSSSSHGQGNRNGVEVKSSKSEFDSHKIDIDRSELLGGGGFTSGTSKSTMVGLARELEQLIKASGPISVADYMLYALQHPKHGYYIREEKKIGSGGDFVTAPEISQVFGELLCVWCVATWTGMGSPERVRMVELGPGKGTLMKDFLRAASSFPSFKGALKLHLVETSAHLKALQMKALDVTEVAEASNLTDTRLRTAGVLSSSTVGVDGKEETPEGVARPAFQLPGGGEVSWHTKLDQVPDDSPVLVLAQEFLDALPVHQFQYTARGWRERLVDIDPEYLERGAEEETGVGKPGRHPFRFVLAREETPPVLAFLRSREDVERQAAAGNDKRPKFLTRPRAGVGVGGHKDWSPSSKRGPHGERFGDGLEVCPEAMVVVKEVAKRVAKHGGGALLIDYGEDHASADSLRCFRDHREVPVLSSPGEADMTADVDFAAIRRVANSVGGVSVSGPVGQGNFLGEMGIGQRLHDLMDQPSVTDKEAEVMFNGYKRLVDPQQMGTKYKVLAITDTQQKGLPVGFMSASAMDLGAL